MKSRCEESSLEKREPPRSLARTEAALEYASRPPLRVLRQREHHEVAAELGVAAEVERRVDGAEAGGRISQTRRKSKRGPAADAGEDRNVLVTLVRVRDRVPMMPDDVWNFQSKLPLFVSIALNQPSIVP